MPKHKESQTKKIIRQVRPHDGSMYDIFSYIYLHENQKNQLNIGKYTSL